MRNKKFKLLYEHLRPTKISNQVTLEEVELLSEQLPIQKQSKLLNRLMERLTDSVSTISTLSKKQRMRKVEAVLHECDLAAEAFTRKTDSPETIRRLREERNRPII